MGSSGGGIGFGIVVPFSFLISVLLAGFVEEDTFAALVTFVGFDDALAGVLLVVLLGREALDIVAFEVDDDDVVVNFAGKGFVDVFVALFVFVFVVLVDLFAGMVVGGLDVVATFVMEEADAGLAIVPELDFTVFAVVEVVLLVPEEVKEGVRGVLGTLLLEETAVVVFTSFFFTVSLVLPTLELDGTVRLSVDVLVVMVFVSIFVTSVSKAGVGEDFVISSSISDDDFSCAT